MPRRDNESDESAASTRRERRRCCQGARAARAGTRRTERLTDLLEAAKVDGRAAVESYNPSGASARLCEDPPRSEVGDRDVSLLDDGPARCGTPLLWTSILATARDELPCKSWVFRRQSGAGQATARRRCAIASTREEEGARDDPPGTAQGRLDAVVHASKAAGVPCRIVRRPVKFSRPEPVDAARR